DAKRAVALATRAFIEGQRAERAVVEQDPNLCRETAACDERASAAYAKAVAPALETLARLGSTTRDPVAFVAAFRACQSLLPDAPPGSCGSLTVDRWAQLEPDNALPWLLAARNARRMKDTSGFDNALRRASQARYFNRHLIAYGELLERTEVREQSV